MRVTSITLLSSPIRGMIISHIFISGVCCKNPSFGICFLVNGHFLNLTWGFLRQGIENVKAYFTSISFPKPNKVPFYTIINLSTFFTLSKKVPFLHNFYTGNFCYVLTKKETQHLVKIHETWYVRWRRYCNYKKMWHDWTVACRLHHHVVL